MNWQKKQRLKKLRYVLVFEINIIISHDPNAYSLGHRRKKSVKISRKATRGSTATASSSDRGEENAAGEVCTSV